MKLFLLLLSTTLLIALNNSNSQTIDINSKNNTLITSKSALVQSNQNSDGIIIDSKELSKTATIAQDTSTIKNEILRVYTSDNLNFKVKIRLKEYIVPIKISIYNMLGNLVEEVYSGTAIEGVDYPFVASNLPNGFYLCILQGPNFRDAEKFTISR
jgi:hypothetical protein